MARELTARGAHPRVGGENGGLHYQGLEGGGSSPRGRGKRDGRPECLRARRLIPAWAGKTSTTATSRSPARAHPRVGGENQGDRIFDRSDNGSSPRGRGKPGVVDRDLNPIRLIPAWAGKTRLPRLRSRRRRAHPRVGGENSWSPTRARIVTGSSPRGRGKRADDGDAAALGGLIPAWAGKTGDSRPHPALPPAHPRVGGENLGRPGMRLRRRGSSPRGRGKPRRRLSPRRLFRLIPAWAGKTWAWLLRARPPPAHPRVGGENPGI